MINIIQRVRAALAPEINRTDLTTLLSLLDPKVSRFEGRIQILIKIMEWLRLPVKSQETQELEHFARSRNLRLKFLFYLLEKNPQQSEFLAHALKEIIVPGQAVTLFCQTGLSENSGFLNELSKRLMNRIMPETYSEGDLAETFNGLFTEEEDAEWLEHSHAEIIPLVKSFFIQHAISFDALMQDQVFAREILGAQIAALGTSRSIRQRMKNQALINSSFLKLNSLTKNNSTDDQLLLAEITKSRLGLEEVRENLESTGVSVEIIFTIEKISALLDRLEILILLHTEKSPQARETLTLQFLAKLIKDELRRFGVEDYLKENLHLLTRKIVERAGEKGSFYIASNPEERRKLLAAAAWAGVLTAFTAIIKYFIGLQHLPLFFEGFFFFINYALGFLMMQKWHLALSSKQPAYMASALSKKFEIFKATRQLEPITLEVRNISYSQLLASFSNLLWVIPVVIIIDWTWVWMTGNHIANQASAYDIIEKHHLLHSLTIPYAILTGILLWLSSIVAGWVENWMVYRNVPDIMKSSSFLNRLTSPERLNSIAENFPASVGGILGNLSIAFFLAAPIIVGKFTAIPLDIRHVTLAAGTVTLALNSLEWNLEQWPMILNMLLSITVIGLLNFSVSFYFALRMAAMAREVDGRHLKIIFKYAFTKRRSKLPE